MRPRLGDEAEHGGERPGEHSRLVAGAIAATASTQLLNLAAMGPGTVKEIVKRRGEEFGSGRRADRIAQRHFLEGKEQIGARFDANCFPGDLGKLLLLQQREEFRLAEGGLPFCGELAICNRVPNPNRERIAEATGKDFEEFAPRSAKVEVRDFLLRQHGRDGACFCAGRVHGVSGRRTRFLETFRHGVLMPGETQMFRTPHLYRRNLKTPAMRGN